MAPHNVRTRVPVSKLRPPRVRHTEVTRQVLLDNPALADHEILAICAPAGYGKTTLGIQWASRTPRPIIWVTLDEADGEPTALMAGLASAVAAALPEYSLDEPLVSDEPAFSHMVLPGFLSWLASLPALTLVLDDLHLIGADAGRHVLRTVIDALPAGSQSALIGRDLHAVPIALWRGQGRVVDIRAGELAFSPQETSDAVRALSRDLDPQAVQEAAAGWPVAVFLLSQSSTTHGVTDIEEFIDTEVLGTMPADLRDFVLATAPLGSLTTDLAAEVSGSRRAGHYLAEAITTVLLQPRDEGYTYHPLFQEHVTALLEREDPDFLRSIRRRAARWHENHGHFDTAVRLAIASDDSQCLGSVLWDAARPTLLSGKARTARLWLDLIDPVTIDRSPELSLAAAWTNVALGEYGDALRHAKCTLDAMPAGWLDDMSALPYRGHLRLLQGVTWVGLNGPQEGLMASLQAKDAIPPEDAAYSLAALTVGLNRALLGDPQAVTDLREAAALAASFGIPSTLVEAQSLLGLELIAAGQQSAGCEAIEQARDVFAFHDLSEMASSSALMALARVALLSLRGRPQDVRQAIAEQADVRAAVGLILPWYRPLSGAVLAEVSLHLGDSEAYREYLSWCEDIACPPGGLCGLWAARARQEYAAASPLAELTPAELRVWELLKTRMTLSEIASELYLSRETVKSHTGAIYRKLGVASRREAQDLAESW